jgi:hypothetical protein
MSFLFPYELDRIILRNRTADTSVRLSLNGQTILTAPLTPDAIGLITLTDLGRYLSDCVEQAREQSKYPNSFLTHTLQLYVDDTLQTTYTLRPCRSRMRRKAAELMPTMFLTMASGDTKLLPPTAEDENLYLLSDETSGAYTYTTHHYWRNTLTNQIRRTDFTDTGIANPGQVVHIPIDPSGRGDEPDQSTQWQLLRIEVESAARRITYQITPDGLTQADITTLQFCNSFGLLDTFHILGKIETDYKTTYSAALLSGSQVNYLIEANPTYKANVGPLTDGTIALLKDLATSRQVTLGGRPITLTAVELKPTNAYADAQTATITWREATEGGTTAPATPLGTFDTTFDSTFDRTT